MGIVCVKNIFHAQRPTYELFRASNHFSQLVVWYNVLEILNTFFPFSGEKIHYWTVSMAVKYADIGWAFEATCFAEHVLV